MDYPKSVPSIGLVDGKFVDEDVIAGTPGSLIPAQWGNGVTEEILNVIEASGLAPAEDNNAQLVAAIRFLQRTPTLLTDTGGANTYTAANAPALAALPASGYLQKVKISNANTGASTYAPDGLAAKPIYGLGLQPLQGGELPAGVAVLMYLVQAGVNGGNGAWIIIESLGGASQVAPATKSQHAMQLGQATGRLLNVQIFSAPGSSTYVPSAGTQKVRVRVIGGGGGGGGTAATTASTMAAAAGGSGGGYAEGIFTSGFSGLTVSVGAAGVAGAAGGGIGGVGGTSSFGGLLSATGGGGGLGSPALSGVPVSVGSDPAGVGSGGTINAQGSGGSPSIVTSIANFQSGVGGGTSFGGGASQRRSGDQGAGRAGFGPGAGGSGAASGGSLGSAGALAGGAGAPGIVIIEEFC
ncbi:hypothetical protein FGE05_19330 [Pseudomonas sp. ICMP22404]|uniref:glycine-rich domain-containing protein n=1 Tax=Pseudomonas TaxID=286 RepID=UPI00111A2FBB|nr:MULTISPECIES: hypothetical protein [Pseudomonas]MCI0994118.1 hypothetical protein [Pseudomonas corrugata]NUT65077.1 hypothetical protein [Pseudomonas corrugata]TNF80919.1 hypothetical protein FGE05_19330 [Pseudomonas sp. ICMP22404]